MHVDCMPLIVKVAMCLQSLLWQQPCAPVYSIFESWNAVHAAFLI